MTKFKSITMNDNFFSKFVDVVSDNSECHSDILDFEETVFSELTLRNAVLYMAEQHSESYQGDWKVVHCTRSDLCFYSLDSEAPIQVKDIKLSTTKAGDEPNYLLDGKVFGLIMSLYAYIFLYYAHIQRKNKQAALSHSTDGHTVKRRFSNLAKSFIQDPTLYNITNDEADSIRAMRDFIETYTREYYEA